MSAKVARTRAEELLELFDLAAASGRLVKHYSGGMRRRLDLAASLVADPPVLFLDEPTTGLDPVSRRELWSLLERLVAGGTTLLLTTQYLDEADALADQIVVLDHGRIVATGTPAELKRRIGAERVAVTLGEATDLEPASRALVPYADGDPAADCEALTVIAAVRPETTLMELVRALDAGGVEAVDIHRREASLDDVFLTLTETRPQAEEVPA
jgi:ABC-2 type transport system ATP-binding protein